jgi:mannose-6-phosphate isomerase-like protein (cupin superfamily)
MKSQTPQAETPFQNSWPTVSNQGIGEILFHEPANENDPPFVAANYWEYLSSHQEEADVVIEFDKMKLAIAEHGGSKAFVVFDEWEPDQIHSSHSYLGFSSPANNNESVHVHKLQTETYIILEGVAELWVKHYSKNSESWKCRVCHEEISLLSKIILAISSGGAAKKALPL